MFDRGEYKTELAWRAHEKNTSATSYVLFFGGCEVGRRNLEEEVALPGCITIDDHLFCPNHVEISCLTQSLTFTFRFNLIRFASEVVSWKPSLASTSDDSCQNAVEWVSDFDANGSTCTLNALQVCV